VAKFLHKFSSVIKDYCILTSDLMDDRATRPPVTDSGAMGAGADVSRLIDRDPEEAAGGVLRSPRAALQSMQSFDCHLNQRMIKKRMRCADEQKHGRNHSHLEFGMRKRV